VDWKDRARDLAADVTHPGSRWRAAVQTTPRHVFAPSWWDAHQDGWLCVNGAEDPAAWAETAYSSRRSMVTRVGALHADDAVPGTLLPVGRPTSSATMAALTVRMLEHLRVFDGAQVLDCGTGSGWGASLLCRVLGEECVTSVDVDEGLTSRAADRLAELQLFPQVMAIDGTDDLPGRDGSYDRLLATFSVPKIPAVWLRKLKVGGRLVTTLQGTSAIVTAYKTGDGGADGVIERDWAGFMQARHGDDYPADLLNLQLDDLRVRDGDQVQTGRFPILHVSDSWEVMSMLHIAVPGIDHHWERAGSGVDQISTAIMWHPDGSWSRAVQHGADHPQVHQGGPRRLYDELDAIRMRWLRDGSLPLYGSTVRVDPDGTLHLQRGRGWEATIG
jgi:protein-L-isoaspartate O-methyltransferase